MCDQWRPDCLGTLGHPVVRTPNLDSLAGRGVVFENAYCASPLCSPARASWLTGLYPHATGQLRNSGAKTGRPGAQLKPGAVTLGDSFKASGYRCGIVGPWHMGNDAVPQHGFQDFWETYRYQGPGNPDRFFDYVDKLGIPNLYDRKVSREQRGVVAEPGYGKFHYAVCRDPRQQRTTWTIDRGLTFLESFGGGADPFFLFLSIKDPHPIVIPPADTLALYPPESLPLPRHLDDPLSGKPSYQPTNDGRLNQPADPAAHRRVMAHYFALLTHVDREIGRFIGALERTGRLDDTIIAFISDHGEMLGDHGLMGKYQFYEPSVRVPCIVSWPRGIPGGWRISTPMAGVDLAPTLVELAGARELGTIDGVSHAVPLQGRRQPEQRPVLAELCSKAAQKGATDDDAELARHVMIRSGNWKYVCTRGDLDELYDLSNDPDEMINLASTPDCAAQVGRLRTMIRHELNRTGPGAFAWFTAN